MRCTTCAPLALLALLCTPASSSPAHRHDAAGPPYGRAWAPHRPGSSGPWFEGWYVRVSGAGGGASFAVGLGHFPAPGPETAARAACFLLRRPPGAPAAAPLAADAAYPGWFALNGTGCARGAAPCFQARAGAACALLVRGASDFELRGTLGGTAFRVAGAPGAAPRPWAPGRDGPEGPAAWLRRLLSLHWYVLSTGTAVEYRLTDLATNASLAGSGVAHLEKNWGGGFPERWLWAQGQAGQAGQEAPRRSPRPAAPAAAAAGGGGGGGGATFVLAGGAVPLAFLPAALSPRLFLLTYQSPGFNLSLDPLYPALPTAVRPDGCAGTIELTLTALLHTVHVSIAAEPGSFAAVTCPTAQGFRQDSVESFAARVEVRVVRRPLLGLAPERWGRVVAHSVWEGAAVEFGGAYRCGGGG
jgi:hypothetical protein